MSSNHTVEIKITAANLADPAIQQLIGELKTVASTAETVSVRTRAAAQGAAAGFEQTRSSAVQASGSFVQMASSLGNVVTGIWAGTQMVSGFARSATGAGMSILGLNANLETSRVAFTQLLGSADAASRMVNDLQRMAAATPFSTQDLQQGARLLLAFGDNAKNIIPHLTAIGDAVSAFGGGSQEIEQVTRALGQMSAKGKVSAEEMNQLSEVGINGFKLLADQMHVSEAEVRKLAESGKILASDALPLLYQGLEQTFGGGMAKQAETFRGMVSSLMDNLRMAATEVSKPFFDVAKRDVQSLVEYTQTAEFGHKVEDWAQRSQQAAESLSAWVTANGPGIFSGLENAAVKLTEVIEDVNILAHSEPITITVNVVRKFVDWIPKEKQGPDPRDFGGKPITVGDQQIDPRDLMPDMSGGGGTSVPALSWFAHQYIAIMDDMGEKTRFLRDIQKDYTHATTEDIKTLTTIATNADNTSNSSAQQRAQYVLQEIQAYRQAVVTAQELAHQEHEVDRLLSNQRSDGGGLARQQAEELRRIAELRATAIALLNSQVAPQPPTTTERDVGHEAATLAASYTEVGRAAKDAAAGNNDLYIKLVAVGNAQQALQRIQGDLSDAYQIGLRVQSNYTAQASEYQTQATNITNAIDALHKKQAEGIPLSKEEQWMLDNYTSALQRANGGIQDATITAGDWAIKNIKLMEIQDKLAGQYPNLVRGSEGWTEALKDAAHQAGLSDEDIANLQGSGAGLVDAISGPGGLTKVIGDLAVALDNLGLKHPSPTVKVNVDRGPFDGLQADLNAFDGHTFNAHATITIGASGDSFSLPSGSANTDSRIPGPPREPAYPPAYSGQNNRELNMLVTGNESTHHFGPPPALVQATQQAHDATADITRLMGDASQQFSDEYLKHLEAYTSAAKSALDLYTETAKLASDGSIQSIQLTDSLRTSVTNLNAIAVYATQTTGDSASQFAEDYLDALKKYTDAAGSSVDLLSSTLQFTKDMGDRVILYGAWQERNVANLKFIAEHATRSVGDSAQLFGGSYLTQLKLYTDAAKGAVELMSTTVSFVKDLGDTTVLFGDWQRTAVANLKFIAEDAARSVGDSAQLFNGPYLGALTTYTDAAKGAVELLDTTVGFVKDLGDTTVLYGQWQQAAIANLKFIAEDATRSVGDSAAIMDGPYLENLKTYTDGAGAAVQLLSSTLDFVDSMREKSGALTLAQTDMTASFRDLARQSRDAADQVGAYSASWTKDLYPNLQDFVTDAGASLTLLGNAADLLTTISEQGKTLLVAQTDNTEIYHWLARQARDAADQVGEWSTSWSDDLHPNLKSFTDAAGASLDLMGTTLDTLQAITDHSDLLTVAQTDNTQAFHDLARQARDAADQVGDVAETWNSDYNQGISDFSDAAGKSLSLLGDTVDLLQAITDQSDLLTAAQTDNTAAFHDLTRQARDAGDQVADAGRTWDSSVNQGITDFTDAAGKSLGLLGTAASTLQALADLPDTLPDVEALGGALVQTALTVSQSVASANRTWEQLVASGQAIPINDVATWADGAGKAVSLVGDVAGAYKDMADISRLTTSSMAIFEHNWELILSMIPDLVALSQPYLDDAKQFKSIAEMIAKEFQDAASAIQTVTGGNAASGHAGTLPSQGAPPKHHLTVANKPAFNEFLAAALGWSTNTFQSVETVNDAGDQRIVVHHTIDTGALNQAIQYQASLLKPTYDHGQENQPLDRTYADEFLQLLQLAQSNTDVFNAAQQNTILQGLKQQLGALGLSDSSAIGNALFGSMGLTPDVLKDMGLDPKTISDLSTSLGQSFLDGTANPVADATAAAVNDAFVTSMGPFAETMAGRLGPATYQAIVDASSVQAQLIAAAVKTAVNDAFTSGITKLTTQLQPASL